MAKLKIQGAPPVEKISCSGCEWWTPPRELPLGAVGYGISADLGLCERFPQPVRKKGIERCGEFEPRHEEDAKT